MMSRQNHTIFQGMISIGLISIAGATVATASQMPVVSSEQYSDAKIAEMLYHANQKAAGGEAAPPEPVAEPISEPVSKPKPAPKPTPKPNLESKKPTNNKPSPKPVPKPQVVSAPVPAPAPLNPRPAFVQASLTPLPVQVPNEIDLPKMVLPTADGQPIASTQSNTQQSQNATPSTIAIIQPPAQLPAKKDWVVDTATLLSEKETKQIQDRIQKLFDDKKVVGRVLIVPSTGGVPIDKYASQQFANWQVSHEVKGNSVTIVGAIFDRKMYIAEGEAIDAKLPDGLVVGAISPFFKQEKYAKGILAGFDKIDQQLTSTNVATPPQSKPEADRGTKKDVLFGWFVLSLLVGAVLLDKIGRMAGATIGAIGFFVGALGLGFVGVGLLGAILVFGLIYGLLGKIAHATDFKHTKRLRGNGGNRFGQFDNTDEKGGRFGGGGAGGSW